MQHVSSTARIPLKQFVGKGSYYNRLQYARKLNYEFFKSIKPELDTGEISVVNYRKALKRLIPDNINVHITPLEKSLIDDGIKGCVSVIGDEPFTGFRISLPYIKKYGKRNKNAKISTTKITTIMHENFHLFSEISNPKHLVRCKFMDDEQYDIYSKNLYGKTYGKFGLGKIINIIKYIKTLPLEERIDFLQNCRYRLTEEHYAFAEGAQYCMGKYNYIPFEFYAQISFLEMLLYINLRKGRMKNKSEFGTQEK